MISCRAPKPSSGVDQRAIDAPISLGTAAAGEDGNVYLMRATMMPFIYVISPGGEVLRRLAIKPPTKNAMVGTMKVATGKVIVMFQEDTGGPAARQIFTLGDAQTGEKLGELYSTPEIGGALACYTAEGLTFVAGRDGKLVLLRAVPQ